MSGEKRLDMAVVGAGYAGLAAAWDLVREGHRVTVFEGMDRPGGLAAGYRDPAWDWTLEHYYHHWFTSDEDIKDLAAEIGVSDQLLVQSPTTAQLYEGKAYALDGVIPVLRFPGMPFLDRFRMGLSIAWLKVTKNWRALETVNAKDWMLRWMGRPAYEAIFEPLMMGKFGPSHADVPMSWLWARLHKRTIKLMYYRGGFQAFADALAEAAQDKGVGFHYGAKVKSIRAQEDGRLQVTLDAPESAAKAQAGAGAETDAAGDAGDAASDPALDNRVFDRVICTTGPHLLARMAPDLPQHYLDALDRLPYLGAVVAVLALDRKLMDEVYWLSIDKRELPFLAVVEHTNFVPSEHYGGENLIYVGDYVALDHPYLTMSEAELLDEWLPALQKINPDFDPSWVKRTWLGRSNYAQPVVPLGFSKHIPSLSTPIPGLFLASMSQVYPWDRGTNYAVEIGRKVARLATRKLDDDVTS